MERQLLAQARDGWNFYQQNYIPLESEQIDRIMELRSPGERNEAIAATVAQARNSAGMEGAARAGDRPGAGLGRSIAMEGAQADVATNAAMLAEQAQEERFQRGRQVILDAGLGRYSGAMQMGGRAAAQQASTQAINTGARNSMNRFNHQRGMDYFGAAVGLGSELAAPAWGAVQRWRNKRQMTNLDQGQAYGGMIPEAGAGVA